MNTLKYAGKPLQLHKTNNCLRKQIAANQVIKCRAQFFELSIFCDESLQKHL